MAQLFADPKLALTGAAFRRRRPTIASFLGHQQHDARLRRAKARDGYKTRATSSTS
jgi:hypothetical protein